MPTTGLAGRLRRGRPLLACCDSIRKRGGSKSPKGDPESCRGSAPGAPLRDHTARSHAGDPFCDRRGAKDEAPSNTSAVRSTYGSGWGLRMTRLICRELAQMHPHSVWRTFPQWANENRPFRAAYQGPPDQMPVLAVGTGGHRGCLRRSRSRAPRRRHVADGMSPTRANTAHRSLVYEIRSSKPEIRDKPE